MPRRDWLYWKARCRREIEIVRYRLGLHIGGWPFHEDRQELLALRTTFQRIDAEHIPAGPFCATCDPSYGAGDGTDGNNPECTHKRRWCSTCQTRWPCKTNQILEEETTDG